MVDRYSSRMGFRGNAGNSNNSSCSRGCGGNNNMNDCKKLMKQLQTIEFALVDTVLYLDAYPCSAEALAYYHKLCHERREILEKMAHCNTPITNLDNRSDRSWDWTDAPWPWEVDAN